MDCTTHLQSSSTGFPNQVAEQLFVGTVENAHDPTLLNKLGITYLLNAAHEFDHPWKGRECYLHIPLYDRTSERAAPFFDQVWQFIEKARRDGTNIMVFCQHGISRSVTLALSYMMRSEQLTLGVAYTKLRTARPEAEPNPGFLRELRQLEARLYDRITTVERLTRFDQGTDLGDGGAHELLRESIASFVAGGDGRIDEETSRRALDQVLTAAKQLSPKEVKEAILPLVCETFLTFGGRSTRDEGARSFLATALHTIAEGSRAFSDAVSDGLDNIQDEEKFQFMTVDVPFAQEFLRNLRRSEPLAEASAKSPFQSS